VRRLLLSVLLVLAVPASAAGCPIPTRRATVPFHDRVAVVYTKTHGYGIGRKIDYFACLRRSRGALRLVRVVESDFRYLTAQRFRRSGHQLAFALLRINTHSEGVDTASVHVADLDRRRVTLTVPTASWGPSPSGPGLESLAVGRTGVVAWVAKRQGQLDTYAVYATAPAPSRLATLSDYALSPVTGVRVDGRVVTWVRDGVEQSAPMP
jgi:hypothetical protein